MNELDLLLDDSMGFDPYSVLVELDALVLALSDQSDLIINCYKEEA